MSSAEVHKKLFYFETTYVQKLKQFELPIIMDDTFINTLDNMSMLKYLKFKHKIARHLRKHFGTASDSVATVWRDITG